jgi:hypothetical protein
MMNDKLKAIVEYLVHEALYGYYDNRSVTHGDEEIAVARAYNTLMSCIKGNGNGTAMAKDITKAVLMAYWGRPLADGDIKGDRFKRSSYLVYKAIDDSIKKTMAY